MKIEDINEIWGKIQESLLLQTRLSGLESVVGLWKIKGDENIAIAIAA